MKLVEVEGSHTLQNTFTSLDIHLGQSYSVLVTADQLVKDYYIVVSSRFTTRVLTTTAILHYSNSRTGVSGPVPNAPTTQIASSLSQARSIRYFCGVTVLNFSQKLSISYFHATSFFPFENLLGQSIALCAR